jgi:glutaredoxin 3
VSVEDHPDMRGQLLARSGRRTLPQVYVGERYIGGAAEVAALDRNGELTGTLQARNDDG